VVATARDMNLFFEHVYEKKQKNLYDLYLSVKAAGNCAFFCAALRETQVDCHRYYKLTNGDVFHTFMKTWSSSHQVMNDAFNVLMIDCTFKCSIGNFCGNITSDKLILLLMNRRQPNGKPMTFKEALLFVHAKNA
jgi:hypothetical protein